MLGAGIRGAIGAVLCGQVLAAAAVGLRGVSTIPDRAPLPARSFTLLQPGTS